MKKKQVKKLDEEAQQCFRVADRMADNKLLPRWWPLPAS